MKKIYFILLCFGLCLACQVEEDNQIINNPDSLNADSPLTGLLKRTTQNPTALDNFIDGSSKIKVEFPANLIINEEVNFSLTSFEDYFSLIQVLENTPIKDTIAFSYPITVSGIDYSETILNSDNDLAEVLAESQESSEVNCIDLSFPVFIRFFDATNSFLDTQVFSNEAQFFNFLNAESNEDLFYDIQFPINATLNNEFETSINSIEDLNTIFQELDNSCFEPLLYENVASGTNPTDLEMFTMFISDGTFQVSELIDEGEQIADYDDLFFNFSLGDAFNGNIIVQQEIVGDWNAFLDDGVIVFELNFDDSFYGELDDDWDVVNYNETSLNLIDISSDGESSSLVFSKIN